MEIHATWFNHGTGMQLQYHLKIFHLLNTNQSQNIVMFFYMDCIYLFIKLYKLLHIPLRNFILILIHAIQLYFHNWLFINQNFYRTILLLIAKSERMFQIFVLREQHFGFVSFFFVFFYAADLCLFLDTGKGLTSAIFMESVDLRPDWWVWHYILESSAKLLPGVKKDGFCLSTSQSLWCAKWSGVI